MKRSSLGVLAFVIVAVALLYGLSRWSQQLNNPPNLEEALIQEGLPPKEKGAPKGGVAHEKPVSLASGEGNILGSPDAKVKVAAVVPMGVDCHMQTLAVLREIAKAEPKRVRVEMYDMNSPEGQKVLAKHGVHCASVFVNGKSEFIVKVNGVEKHIVCQKKPNVPGAYFSTDLIEVVHQELQRQYKKGFDPKTLQKLRVKGNQILGVQGGIPFGFAITGTPPPSEPTGKKAKVVVEVLMPGQQAPIHTLFANTVETLNALKKRYGDALGVQVYPLMTPEGQAKLRALKLSGPAVVINGKTTHQITEPGKGKRVVVTEFGKSERLFTPTEVKQVVVAYLQQAQPRK